MHRQVMSIFLFPCLLIFAAGWGFSSDMDDLAAAYSSFSQALHELHSELAIAHDAASPAGVASALHSFCDLQESVLNTIRTLSEGQTFSSVPQNVRDAANETISAVQLTAYFPELVDFCIGEPGVPEALQRFYALLDGE